MGTNLKIGQVTDNFKRLTSFYDSGHVRVEQWIMGGFLHNDEDRPAMVDYFDVDGETCDKGERRKGAVCAENWFRHGKYYRENGKPTTVYHSKCGTVSHESYCGSTDEK